MSKFSKTLLLAASGGFVFLICILTAVEFARGTSKMIQGWDMYIEFFSLFMLGAIICLIFGAPSLYIIDKYFSRYETRYVIGGAVAGWFTWFVMVGPIFRPNTWLEGRSWVLGGGSHVGVYVGLGFCTGALFTALLWLIERRKRNKQ